MDLRQKVVVAKSWILLLGLLERYSRHVAKLNFDAFLFSVFPPSPALNPEKVCDETVYPFSLSFSSPLTLSRSFKCCFNLVKSCDIYRFEPSFLQALSSSSPQLQLSALHYPLNVSH